MNCSCGNKAEYVYDPDLPALCKVCHHEVLLRGLLQGEKISDKQFRLMAEKQAKGER